MRPNRFTFQAFPGRRTGFYFFAVAMLLGTGLQAQTVSFSGRAFELATGKHVYNEYITRKFNNGKIVSQYTVYKDPSGKTIGTKTLSFPRGYLANFALDDQRDGYQEGSTVQGGSVQMFLKKSADQQKETKSFPIPANPIADDGIDLYLRENLEKLKGGQALDFNLAVPNKWDWFKFTAKSAGEIDHKGRKALVVTMTLSNVLLRKLLPPIKFVYDLENKSVYEFQGVSALNGPEKKSYRVRTVYGPETKK